ncbi:MAG: LacI family transcriptional regulator [Clostridia bacterium]|nr:LacI family transcriptional regulator [Clostridia bacterium]
MANINDVAKKAGVSKSTVSNVFNGKKNVSDEIRQKVLKIADDIGYYPNKLASALTTKRTGLTGLFIDNNSKFRYMDYKLIEGVSRELKKSNKHIILYLQAGKSDDDNQIDINNKLISEPIDDAIIVAPMVKDIRINELIDMRKSIVIIGQAPNNSLPKVKCLDVDNIKISYEVTKYLLELGHRKITLINSDPNMTISIDRMKGYLAALKEYNVEFNPEYTFNSDNTEAMGEQLGSRIFKSLDMTAVITSSDEIASGLYNEAKKAGISIPDDISIFALGGTDKKLNPSLCTVYVDYEMLGREAVALLSNKEVIDNQVIDSYKLLISDSIKSIL